MPLDLLKRSENGVALSAIQHDANLTAIEGAVNTNETDIAALEVAAAARQILGPYTYAALQALSTAGLVTDVSMASVSSPAAAEGLWVWRGSVLGWKQESRRGIFAKLEQWFALPFVMRARTAAQGGTPFWRMRNLSDVSVLQANTPAGLSAAISAVGSLAEHQRIIDIRSNITLVADITLTAGVCLISTTGATISGAYNLIVTDNNALVGLEFSAAGIAFRSTDGAVKPKIIACRFASGGVAIQDFTTSNNNYHVEPQVALCEFTGRTYGTYWQRTLRGKIVYNKWTNSAGAGRGFYFVGGMDNEVRHNIVDGGVVSIGALIDRRYAFNFDSNRIRDNICRGASEESISIDTYGNLGAQMSVIDRLSVTAYYNSYASNPKLKCTRTTTADITAGRTAAVFLTGALVGKSFPIVYVETEDASNIRLQFANRSISDADLAAAVGGTVAIVIRCNGNVIADNLVEDAVLGGIVLWGTGQNTAITGNIVSVTDPTFPGIRCTSLGGLSPTSAVAAAAGTCIAPVTNTMVSGNVTVNGTGPLMTGMFFTTEASTIDNVEPLPQTGGVNNLAMVVGKWRNEAGNIVSSEDAAVITSIAGTLDESLVIGPLELQDADLGDQGGEQTFRYAVTATTAQVNFDISHGLARAPTTIMVTPMSSGAREAFHASIVDQDTIRLTYASAPGNGIAMDWSIQLKA